MGNGGVNKKKSVGKMGEHRNADFFKKPKGGNYKKKLARGGQAKKPLIFKKWAH